MNTQVQTLKYEPCKNPILLNKPSIVHPNEIRTYSPLKEKKEKKKQSQIIAIEVWKQWRGGKKRSRRRSQKKECDKADMSKKKKE